MKHTNKWESDWKSGVEELYLSRKLLPIFESYLVSLAEKGMSKTTMNRHSSACHALGGYIVDDVYHYQRNSFSKDATGKEILLHFIDTLGGPLIHHNDETWQRELDSMCKKLNTYLLQPGKSP